MVIWINGAFGGGKTTTAKALVEAQPKHRLVDPEHVGYLLRSQLADIPNDDFQDLAPWRELVPAVIDSVHRFTGDTIVAPQTVMNEAYWFELRAGLASHGRAVTHVLLDCAPDALRDRIRADTDEPDACQWRLDHVEPFLAARPWLLEAADVVIDTTERATADVVAELLRADRDDHT